MAVTCRMCDRSLPEEPGALLTQGERRFPVAHVNERGAICPLGSSELSTDVCDLVTGKIRDGSWLDMLELGPDLVSVACTHEHCRWTGGRWYPCDTRPPEWSGNGASD